MDPDLLWVVLIGLGAFAALLGVCLAIESRLRVPNTTPIRTAIGEAVVEGVVGGGDRPLRGPVSGVGCVAWELHLELDGVPRAVLRDSTPFSLTGPCGTRTEVKLGDAFRFRRTRTVRTVPTTRDACALPTPLATVVDRLAVHHRAYEVLVREHTVAVGHPITVRGHVYRDAQTHVRLAAPDRNLAEIEAGAPSRERRFDVRLSATILTVAAYLVAAAAIARHAL